MDTGQCLCHALMKSLCLPCQVKVHLMHLTTSPHGHMDSILDALSDDRSAHLSSPPNTTNPTNANCTNCNLYMEIISKLSASVCDDEIMNTAMSCVVGPSASGKDSTGFPSKKNNADCQSSSANLVSAILRGQNISTDNPIKNLISCLKASDPGERNSEEFVSNSSGTKPFPPPSTSIKIQHSAKMLGEDASNVGTIKNEKGSKKRKEKSTSEQPVHLQATSVSNSNRDRENMPLLRTYRYDSRDVQEENAYKIAGKLPKINLFSKNVNSNENTEQNHHLPDGVIKHMCYEKKSRRTSAAGSDDHDEVDERIDRCLETFYRERSKSPHHRKCSRSPCRKHGNSPGSNNSKRRSIQSAQDEFPNPLTFAFRSKSCGQVNGESYEEMLSFNSSPIKKTTRKRGQYRSGEKKIVYETNSEGQCTSMVIGVPVEDSAVLDPDSNILINFKRGKLNGTHYRPSKVDKAEQTLGGTDVGTQFDYRNQHSFVCNDSIGKQKIPSKPGSAAKQSKHPGQSRTKMAATKAQPFRQPRWKK